MLIPVLLYGILGKKYGKRHMLAVKNPGEAVRALSANFPTFQRDLMEYQGGFHVFRGRENLSKEQINEPSSRDAIRFVPYLNAAKSGGVLQIIEGIVLIVVSAVLDYFTGGAFGEATGYTTYKIGGLLILGGIVQVLFAPPAAKTTPSEKNPANQPSYVFNGPVNTTAQGHNVPVGYGRLRVGSAVISGGITVSQIGTNGANSVDTTTPTGPMDTTPIVTQTLDGGSLGGGVLRTGPTLSGVAPDLNEPLIKGT